MQTKRKLLLTHNQCAHSSLPTHSKANQKKDDRRIHIPNTKHATYKFEQQKNTETHQRVEFYVAFTHRFAIEQSQFAYRFATRTTNRNKFCSIQGRAQRIQFAFCV